MPSLVNQFKDVELHYDAPSGATFYFFTSMPGGAMTLRRTIAVPATSGAQIQTLPFDTSEFGYQVVEGALYKVRITAPGVFRGYKGLLRYRRIGTWFDGSNGEHWETTEIAL